MQLDNVLVLEDVVSLGVLAVVNACPPYPCEFQFIGQFPVNGICQVHNGRADRQSEGFAEVGFFAGRLGVDAYDAEEAEKDGG